MGETLQQMQEFAKSPSLKKNWLMYSSPSKAHVNVLPSITMHIFLAKGVFNLYRGGRGVSIETFFKFMKAMNVL